MDITLSKFSPQARKAMRRADADVKLRATIELARGKSPDELAVMSTAESAHILSWSPLSNLMTLEIAPNELKLLAEDNAVTYVEVGGRMQN